MATMAIRQSAAVVFLGAVATAQSLTLSAPAAITASATYYTSTQTLTLPSGPLSPSGSVHAHTSPSAPTPHALLAWNSFANATQMGFVGSLQCSADGAGVGQASVVPGQILVELVAPVSTPVTIEMSRTLQLTAGAPAPLLRIDVDDDGYFECTEFTPNSFTPRTLSPTPLRIRVILSGAVVAPAAIVAELQVLVRPDNHTTPTFVIGGCEPGSCTVAPTFDGNLSVRVDTAPQQLAVAVFGLGLQPMVLPAGTAMPCILLPTADHLLLVPGGTAIVLAIPPAARPITFWTQAVVVSTPFRLGTTDGYAVSAL